MSPSNDERRFSEEDFALVLRMASEDEVLPERASAGDGLSLTQMREIAAEVGIDPDRISRAVALLPDRGESVGVRFLGGHPRHRLEHTIFGEVAEKDLTRIVQVARTALGVQGEAREVLGAMEWKGSNNVTGFWVSATPGEGKTILVASTDRTEAIMGIYGGVGMGVLGIVALSMVKLVFGETDTGIVAGLLSGLPAGFLAARTVWTRSTRSWRERLLRLMDAMAEEAEGLAAEGEAPEE